MPVLRAEPNGVMEVAVPSGLDLPARSLMSWAFPPVVLVYSDYHLPTQQSLLEIAIVKNGYRQQRKCSQLK